jgi:acyl carrier protein
MGLDSVELLIRVEQHFAIAIPDYEAAKITTVQDLADCVYTKVTTSSLHPLDKGDVEKTILEIVSDSSGIPVNEIKLEHEICYDLGID